MKKKSLIKNTNKLVDMLKPLQNDAHIFLFQHEVRSFA